MPRSAFGFIACLLLCLGLTAQVAGNGVIRDGLGAIATGRGGTNIAFADNTLILVDNPAGMVNYVGQGMFEIGVSGLVTDLQYQDPFTSDSASVRPMGLPDIGLFRRTEEGTLAYGVVLAAPAGFGAHFSLDDPVFGPQSYSSFGALVKVLPGAAWKVTDQLSVGGTLGLGFSRAKLDGPFFVQSGVLQGVPTLMDLSGNGTCMVWSLGAQYQLTSSTTIGLAYQSESRMQLGGTAKVTALGLGPDPIFSAFDADIDIRWPRTLGLGIKQDIGERHRVSTDLIWVNWANAFDNLGVRLTNASNPVIPAVAGPAIYTDFPLRWRDSLAARIGYEFFPTEQSVLRAGYLYNSNQAPDDTLTPFIPATLEHAFSVGGGIQRGWYNFNIAYQYSFGPDRISAPSSIIGGDFENSQYGAQAHWLSISILRQF